MAGRVTGKDHCPGQAWETKIKIKITPFESNRLNMLVMHINLILSKAPASSNDQGLLSAN